MHTHATNNINALLDDASLSEPLIKASTKSYSAFEEKISSTVVDESVRAFEEAQDVKVRKQNLRAINLSSLQAGDILLYLPKSSGLKFSHKMIACSQTCIQKGKGDSTIVHSGIFYGFEKNAPMIAHLVGAGFKVSKLKEDQPLLIFRPSSSDFAAAIAKQAGIVNASPNKPKWTFSAAIGVILDRKSARATEGKKSISQNSVCSKLVAQVIESAADDEKAYMDFRLNKSSNATPKDLEADLFQNHNYKMLFYLGNQIKQSPLEVISQTVEAELKRLSLLKGEIAQRKFQHANQEYDGCIMRMSQEDWDSLEKAMYLEQTMRDVFTENTGCGFRNQSLDTLAKASRKLGLFKTVLNRYKEDGDQVNHQANLDLYSRNIDFRINVLKKPTF